MSRFSQFFHAYWKIISLLILVLITFLSLTPQADLPVVAGTDKTHHFIAYATLIFAVAFVKPKKWLWIAVFFFCWSGAIELIQPYVNRYGEWLDLAANTGGLISGFIIARIMAYICKKKTLVL
ncbi:VanZ family protein [Photobacterium phosphoreum]|uniref:VanZ family protein n=1 Tax=Photobacterium phosphoreum TaxID=659 RepID=UPI001E5A10F4|nr:VanZ family protein [Photobacterium phosphoreum]MCD9518663.1 VanZ family protein [Photobacterium phosphoreum]